MSLAIDKAKVSTAALEITQDTSEADPIGPDATEDAEVALTEEDIVNRSLEELNMTKEDAFAIVEAVFTEGVYQETVQIRKGLSVTFRTRSASEEMRLKEELIMAGDMAVWERNYLVQVHNLATSLVSIGDRELEAGVGEDEYRSRKEMVMSLPNVLVDVLVRKLSKFDMKVMVACQDPLLRDF